MKGILMDVKIGVSITILQPYECESGQYGGNT